MGLETGTYIDDLDSANPLGTDAKSKGDDHIRLIKSLIKATFPGMAGAAWRIQSKGAGYTVLVNDNMSVIRCTAALTLTLTASATLGNQHMFMVFADGGIVTIDPNSAETINGTTTQLVPDGAAAIVFNDASNAFAVSFPTGKDFRHEWVKGGDIASADPLVIDDDGNYFDVTGTTGFAALTVPVGALVMLQFDGALTLTHHATNLNLPGGANIVTAAGDRLIGFAPAADDFHVLSFAQAGNRNFQDLIVQRPILLDYGESHNAIGGTGGGTQDIDLTLGNVVSATVDTSTNTFTFSNPTASANGCSFTFIVTNGGSQTIAWPATVDWVGSTAPTLTTSGVDVLTFITLDGGTIWYGFVAGLDLG